MYRWWSNYGNKNKFQARRINFDELDQHEEDME